MTAVIVIAGFMLASLALALLVGACMDSAEAGDLHDGATISADRAETYRLAREQEASAADEFGGAG